MTFLTRTARTRSALEGRAAGPATRFGLPLAVVVAACSVASSAGPLTAAPQPSLQVLPAFGTAPRVRGLALGLYPYPPPEGYAQLLREIRAMGASHVSLVVQWGQPTVTSAELAPTRLDTAPDPMTIRAIRYARKIGLEVMLFPIVQVRERAKGQWRGTIRPPSWKAWFASYRRFILHYARIARRHGVGILAVGSELVSTERRRADWARLIREVRRVFPGKLVYSANWDHYRPISFWDLVDYVGINGYYEVGRSEGTSLAALRREWARIRRRLEGFAAKVKRPLLITEIGYPSLRGGATWPWHYTRKAPVDLGEQARAYRAFIEAWQGAPRLAGVFFWRWAVPGGPKDGNYTPRNKPAGRLLRAWYQGRER